MRKPFIVANWKMNHSVAHGLQFLTKLSSTHVLSADVETVICPPFTSLSSLAIALGEDNPIKLGAQNCHWEEKGAFTGEVSASFLKEIGCQYVLVGHSERRELFGETNQTVNQKTKSILHHEMNALVCVGESEAQRANNQTMDVIAQQLNEGVGSFSADDWSSITIAYEPIWAIGTGKTASAAQAQEVHAMIRQWLADKINAEVSEKTRLLYGGSVKPDNISELMKQPDIDGALVGGASLKVDSFAEIVNYA